MTLFTPLLVPLFAFFSLWTSIRDVLSAMMQPLYWAVSGLVVLFHSVWSPVFGADSGWTWTLAIVSLTVVIRILLIPLFVRQINSARSMQLIQPKLKALQERHGSDRERLAQEQMKLYREEGVNPAASCLPLLLQAPIFLALFRVLEGAAAQPHPIPRGTFFKAHPELMASLSHSSIFNAQLAGRFFPINNGFGATQVLSMVLILAMSLVLFVTQLQLLKKNMPPESLTGPMAQQQKTMLYLFPFIYLFTGISIPIGVLIYWLTTNVWTMGQQWIIIRNNPSPNTPAYIEWEERMRARGKDPHAIEAERSQKRKRRVVSDTPAAEVVEEDGTTRHVVARQNVKRQTVRKDDAEAKQVISRQQPQRQNRAARKKN